MKDADFIRQTVQRAQVLLDNALLKKSGTSLDRSLPPPEDDDERQRYDQLRRAADAIVAVIDDDQPLPLRLVLEYSFLWGITQGIELNRPDYIENIRHDINKRAGHRADTAFSKWGRDAMTAFAKWWESRRDKIPESAAAVDRFIIEAGSGRRTHDRLKKFLRGGTIEQFNKWWREHPQSAGPAVKHFYEHTVQK